jgi:sialidase-1
MIPVLLSLTLAAVSALAAPPTTLAKADVFQSGAGGYALYRIPGLVVTSKGTLLAYAEARKTERGDWGTINIVMRRSTDGGKTWSDPAFPAQVDGPKQKNPVALAQKLATTNEVTYNNPVAITDRNGAVHFVFCLEYARAFYMRSDDDGRTFSKPVEITPAFEGFRSGYDWKVLATGPGHGIQLRSGRLLIPIWLSTGTGGHAHRPSVAATIVSDDHGKTWKAGAIALPNTAEFIIPNETAAVELPDGRVLLNARSESKSNRRILTYSPDGSSNWTPMRFAEELWEPVCMGSMIRLGKRILFSNPYNLDRTGAAAEPGKNRDRRNLSVAVSEDNGKTWPRRKSIEPGWSGYSDLAVARDGTIYLLYERGGIGDDHFRTAALTLASFGYQWLSQP